MIRKIYLPVLLATLLAGCGGSSATYSSVSYPQLQSQSAWGKTLNPYKAPLLDNTRKQAYLDAINEARRNAQDCGSRGEFTRASPLKWNDALYKAAYEHSNDLAQSNSFDHKGSGRTTDHTGKVLNLGRGSTFKERIVNNGYTNLKAISENITAGTIRDTAKKAVAAWLKSDGHCANLMHPDFREVGMAHVAKPGTTFTHYWTQNFAKPL